MPSRPACAIACAFLRLARQFMRFAAAGAMVQNP